MQTAIKEMPEQLGEPLRNMFADIFGLPDVQAMIPAARAKAARNRRTEELEELRDFIVDADLRECNQIISSLIERVSTLLGCAPELEDAQCVIAHEISMEDRAGEL